MMVPANCGQHRGMAVQLEHAGGAGGRFHHVRPPAGDAERAHAGPRDRPANSARAHKISAETVYPAVFRRGAT